MPYLVWLLMLAVTGRLQNERGYNHLDINICEVSNGNFIYKPKIDKNW